MKVIIAKTAGFCMGVRRAAEMALNAAKSRNGPIYTFGPLIHNPQFLALLEERGIFVLSEIPPQGTGTVLIRAHGVPPQTAAQLQHAGFSVTDATCPKVVKVQRIIDSQARKNSAVIIVGEADHPEIIGLLGHAGARGYVIGGPEDLERLPVFDRAIIVAQTTLNARVFGAVRTCAQEKYPHYRTFNTICDSTERRQAEVKRLAEMVDAVIVVGGHHSGNTKRLAEIARESGKPAFHVESESELTTKDLSAVEQIGITAGASTPNWVIKRVQRTLESLPLQRNQGWRKYLFTVLRTLLLTNSYVSVGAGGLCFACSRLQGFAGSWSTVLIAVLYVQSMHILNNLTGGQADRYNDPDRAAFYKRYRPFLLPSALLAGGGGLAAALTAGWLPFVLLLVMSILGISYNFRILPAFLTRGRYLRFRDIPGSKTILIAGAWAIVAALLAPLSRNGGPTLSTVPVFLWAWGLVFVRTAFFDILDMQ
ncbi:MAG: 4-hydroxy-3-methylbut-2-enyl diphosphate reductase, partial [Desulfobacterales bacterium]|nr:4-hydroxy-3-methylbut-2-enyl diphosphate reductase [Desulfobacterales bacterium]